MPKAMPRRDFLTAAGGAGARGERDRRRVAGGSCLGEGESCQCRRPRAAASSPESLVKVLYDTLSPKQRETICFAWDYQDPKRGLLRTRVANNWDITEQIRQRRDFYTKDQQAIIREHLRRHHQPRVARADRQAARRRLRRLRRAEQHRHLRQPGSDKFEFVMTGRHMTIRCDGNSADHVAFGGPIFYGHAADGFNEGPTHPGNVFWPQAQAANKLYKCSTASSRSRRCCTKGLPDEQKVGFRGKDGEFQGLPVTELSSDQKEHLQKVMAMLVEPYRQSDRDEVTQVPQDARRPRRVPPGVLRRRATSATTACGTSGGSKARRSSGTTAARRTCTCG